MLSAIGEGPDGLVNLKGRTTSELEAHAERAGCRWYRQQFLGGEPLIRLSGEWIALPQRMAAPAPVSTDGAAPRSRGTSSGKPRKHDTFRR